MIKAWNNILLSICCLLISSISVAYPNIEGIQVYQKNLAFSEAHKQSLAEDINRFHNADNMWDLLRSEFTLHHYEDAPEVQEQLNFFMSNPNFLLHSAQRAAPYLYYISQQVKKRHLPLEMVLLPMIESAYNPFAYSTAGAGGIWQIMPSTATGFGIKQNWWYDGRRDIIASTKAALDYLVYLGGFFDGNWLLAIAAYNTGEGNVLAAIHKNSRDGKSTDFWSLPLAQQTRDYVPRLLALAIIIANPERYPIDFPSVHNAPYLAQVDIGGPIDLLHAAYLAGLSTESLKQLNPGFNHTTTGPNGPYKLILPIQNVKQFTENFMRSSWYEQIQKKPDRIKSNDTLVAFEKKFKTTPSFQKINKDLRQAILNSEKHQVALNNEPYSMQPGDTLYMVREGDNLNKIANKFHLPIKTVLVTNQLSRVYTVPVGSKLILPTHLTQITNVQKYQLAPGDTIYIVRNGDTVEKIAKKFHLTSPDIRLANLLTSNTVQEGDRLMIPTHG
jgi:membrane-bound lytic murein transglycosylase D